MKMNNMKFFIVFVAVHYVRSADEGGFDKTWNYNHTGSIGPAHWAQTVPKHCNDSRQSPVNIQTSRVVYNPTLKPLTLENYNNVVPNVRFYIENHGHGLAVNVNYIFLNKRVPISLIFNGTKYTLHSFHFHWGKVDTRGSEHQIDGKSYSAELHILHYNIKYDNISEALKHNDGVVVWGNLIAVVKFAKETNTDIGVLLQYARHVEYAGTKIQMVPFAMSSILPKNSNDYYNYPGSLTTPACDETITWVVNKDIIKITADDMRMLRKLRTQDKLSNDSTTIYDNYRPPQPLNNRAVESSFKQSASLGIRHGRNLFSLCLLLLVQIMIR